MLKIPKVILIIERSRSFGRGLLHGIIQYSNLHGHWLYYMKPEFYRQDKEKSHKWLTDIDADGVIAHTWDPDFIDSIVNLGLPAVICGLDKPKHKACRLSTDEIDAGRMAAEYFIQRGFRNFAYCGFDDMIWSQQKCDGFKRILAESGFQTSVYQQPGAKHLRKPAKEQSLIAAWLESLPKPVALMACNDDRGLDILAACKIAECKIPDDVAILGVDNDELICNFSYPQLSSIALSTERAGYEAAKILDKLMRNQKITENEKEVTILPLHVVTRQSTDIMAIEDKDVAEAISFIRRHSREIIQVGDVAQAVGLSRRALEQHFRKVLNHSIHEEIKYTRINQMANMLIGTNLSVSQIAKLLGYPYAANNIARYFKQQKGMSPLDYRKKFAPK
ncbi:MAG: DNA-binding transcriptional regulator [Phycisphaerae bacterium]|nr:DNA-binding transcriptional regulator [Phycisphaerae bacterium]MDD5381977.1 DNA-binding transcriptional regulator [Phycisphaerae bacterium]